MTSSDGEEMLVFSLQQQNLSGRLVEVGWAGGCLQYPGWTAAVQQSTGGLTQLIKLDQLVT